MADVVLVGLHGEAIAALLPEGVRVRTSTPDRLAREIDPRTTAAVLAPADIGIDVARRVHDLDPQVGVLLVADDDAACARTRGELAITPGIGRHTTCLSLADDEGRVELRAEVERGRLRLTHVATMARVREEVGPFEGAPPETLSVYLGQLFEHAPLGILLVDPDATVRAANPASGQVLGWRPRHAVGTDLGAMFPAGDGEVAVALVRDCTTTGDPQEATTTRTGPDGTTQHLDVTVAPVDPEHPDLGVFVLLRDETTRVRALEAAEHARSEAQADAERYAELAWTLQESLLPPDLPAIDGVGVGARFHPAGDGSDIGGDFYDIFQLDEEEWFAVIGDICGKGAGAARLTALTRYTLRAATARTRSIERSLADLNAALSLQYEADRPRGQHRFATATAVRFGPTDDGGLSVEAGSGGHPPPLLVRASGAVEEMASRGPLLGVFPSGTFTSDLAQLAPGDVLVLYTDGVIEARRGREEYGDDRLRALLASVAGRSPDEVAGAVEDAVVSFQAGVARDDIAVLAVGPVR